MACRAQNHTKVAQLVRIWCIFQSWFLGSSACKTKYSWYAVPLNLPCYLYKFRTNAHRWIYFLNDFMYSAREHILGVSSTLAAGYADEPAKPSLAVLAPSLLQHVCLGNVPVLGCVCMFELPRGLPVSIWAMLNRRGTHLGACCYTLRGMGVCTRMTNAIQTFATLTCELYMSAYCCCKTHRLSGLAKHTHWLAHKTGQSVC